MPEKSEAQKRAQRSYMEKFARVELRITPEQRDQIRNRAAANGQSVNAWIIRAIDEALARE